MAVFARRHPSRYAFFLSIEEDSMNSHISIIGNKIWCPRCQEQKKFLKTHNAAALADVIRRTIYRYIDEGKIYVVKVAGNTYRVCSGCLLKSKL